MKKAITLLTFSFFYFISSGQVAKAEIKNLPIDTSFLKYKTIEEVLALPPAYKVISYEVAFSTKGEIFKIGGGPDVSFPPQLLLFVSRAAKGDKLIFDEIMLSKGARKIKLAPKNLRFNCYRLLHQFFQKFQINFRKLICLRQ